MTTCEFGATQLEVFDLQSIALPATRLDFAYDVDGDGRPENQLGNIVGVLLTVGLDPQAEIDGAFLVPPQSQAHAQGLGLAGLRLHRKVA